MGLIDKLKNVFFEEEEVEVEEKPRKKEKKEAKKEEKPIAKKIELPVARKPKRELVSYDLEDEVKEEPKEEVLEDKKEEKKPSAIRDFSYDDYYVEAQPVKQSREQRHKVKHEEIEEKPHKKKEEEVKEEVKEKEVENNDVHLYEGNPDRKTPHTFKPTPVISPVYGILDKNYRKEDVVTKKEIRLSTATAKNVDLDSVREKAYGDLTSDITSSMMEVEEKIVPEDDKKEEKENAVYDLSDDNQPAVSKVTMGDAEEYFNELGLEYNVDYKDTTEEKKEPAKKKKEKPKVDKTEEKEDEPEKDFLKMKKPKEDDEENLEDNLFDLIESMYDEKE